MESFLARLLLLSSLGPTTFSAAPPASPNYPAGTPGSSSAVPFAPAPCAPGRYAVSELQADGGGSGGVPRAHVCALCPAGRYGTDYGLRSAACSGACARGHWCPAGSTGPRERPCPAGRFGASHGLTSPACSGPCREGYWCPERSVMDTYFSCGAVYLFCPRGSATPRQVAPGHYTTGGGHKSVGDLAEQYDDEYTRTSQRLCEPGYFCGGVAAASNAQSGSPEYRGHNNGANSSAREAQRSHPGGIRRDCPAGTFGSVSGLETVACSGPCPAGFYCPKRTVVPTRCPAGRYGSPEDADRVRNTSKTAMPWKGDKVAPLNRPENIVSYSVGLDNARCTGSCALGHYCPAASTRSTQVPCPAGRYGNVTGLRTADCSPECNGMDDTGEALSAAALDGRGGRGGGSNDVGSFATGSYICPSGSESLCEPGFFCPVGSTSSTMKPCGGSTRYCPKGSRRPIPVTLGYFTTPIGAAYANTRSSQVECPRGSYCIGGIRTLCPAGRYGSTTGLSSSDCTGPCMAGFYCKIGAWDRQENSCGGTHVYCPRGSRTPTPVSTGYHTTGGNPLQRTNQSICDPGSYCDPTGVRRLCPPGTYGNQYGMVVGCEAACPVGHYCTIGSTAPVACPAGRFGDRTNLTTSDCSGRCYEGYYCTTASDTPTQHECGDERYICPVGSGPIGSGAPQERTLRPYSGAGGVECDPDSSFYGECPMNTIEASHSSFSFGDDRFDPFAAPGAI